jgi:ribosomal protein S18 acetylase RimI-like enzyme
MSDVRIRDATADDIPFLRRMQWEALLASPRLVAAIGLDNLRQIEERVWSVWLAPDESAFVAEDAQGHPLGALILRVQEHDGSRVVGHRLAMAVEAAARRRGIGRHLLEHAKRYSQAAGADYLLLQVDPSNDPALQAYLATGFQLGDTHGVVPMVVRFDGAGES